MKNKIIVLILILSSLTVFADKLSDIYSQANEYYWNKDYINAVKYYRKIINNYPASSYTDKALFRIGSSFFEIEDYQNAAISYSQLIEDFAGSNLADDALFRLGECYSKLGDWQNSKRYYSDLINKYPNSLLLPQAKDKINFLIKNYDIKSSTNAKVKKRNLKTNDIENLKEAEITIHPNNKRSNYKSKIKKKIIEKKYIIKPSDTLTSIAEKFFGDFNKYVLIADYNNIKDPTKISIGQTILIPIEVEEQVVANDTPKTNKSKIKNKKFLDQLNDLRDVKMKRTEDNSIVLEDENNISTINTSNKNNSADIYEFKLKKEKQNFNNLLVQERNKRKRLLQKIRILEEKITRMNLDIATYRSNLQSFKEYKNKVKNLEKVNEDLSNILKEEKQKKILLEAKYKAKTLKLTRDFDNLQNQYNIAKKSFEDKKYIELLKTKDLMLNKSALKIKELVLNNENLNKDLNLLKNQMTLLQKEVIDINSLKEKISTLQEIINNKDKSIAEKMNRITQLSLENKNQAKKEIELNQELAKRKALLRSKDNIIKNNQLELDKLKVEKQMLAKKIISLEHNYDTILANNKNLIKSLKNELALNKIKVSNKTLEIQKLSKENISLKNNIINLQKKLVNEKNSKNAVTANNINFEHQLSELHNKIKELKTKNLSLNNNNELLSNKIAELTEKITNLEMDVKYKKDKLENLLTKNSNSKTKTSENSLTLNKLNSQLNNLKEENNYLKQIIDTYKKRLSNDTKPIIKKDISINLISKKDKLNESLEHIKKGIQFKKQSKYSQAENEFKLALKIDASNAEAYNSLAFLYTDLNKNLDEALGLINKAIILNPADKGYYLDTLGWIYYKKQQYDKAKENIQSAIKNIPAQDKLAKAQIHLHLGLTFLKLNDENNAFFQFIDVLKLAPNTELYSIAKQKLDSL